MNVMRSCLACGCAAVWISLALVALPSCRKQSSPVSSGQNTPAPSEPKAVAKAPDVQVLCGRWLRPDGPYILDLKSIGSDGKIQAAYVNPQREIHVSRAEASVQGTTLRVFLMLDDDGYPGCTYNLNYDPQQQTLSGIYFQAQMQESFEVVFIRAPAEAP